jgi:cysteine desulfurase
MADPIYLDHSATTPILPEVAQAIHQASLRFTANPSSQHEPGRRARRALEAAREEIGVILGAQTGGLEPDQIVLTSGGTEANNLALHGFLPKTPPSGGRIVISAIEHSSVSQPARSLARSGWQVDTVGVDHDGIIRIDQLEQLLTPTTLLVSLMLGNNETGILQPVEEAARLCIEHGIRLHTDAVQVIGKLPVKFQALGASAMSCTAHKFHGPLGIGALVLHHRHSLLQPLMLGGHQQSGLRPGTETVGLAIGMATALACWQRDAVARARRLVALRERLEGTILAHLSDAVVLGSRVERLPHMSNIAFPGLNRQQLVMALDLAGVACSSGSACASGSSEPSTVLRAMGCRKPIIDGSIRLSWGAQTTPSEIDQAAHRILSVCKHLRRNC